MTTYNITYSNNLIERRGKRPLKIPCNLAEKILSDKPRAKAICVWLELKPLFYNGQIENARTKAAEIAHYLSISRRNYYKQIKRLKSLGLVSFDSAGTLFLASWRKFFFIHGIDRPGRFRFYRLKDQYSKDVENHLRIFAIKENFKKQEYAIEDKVFTEDLRWTHIHPLQIQHNQIIKTNIPKEDKERIGNNLIVQMDRLWKCEFKGEHKLKSKFRKSGKLREKLKEAERIYYKNYSEFDQVHAINFEVSMSCERMAKLYGLKSRSSGHYWQKKLSKLGLMEIQSQYITINKDDHSFGRFIFAMQEESMKLHHYLGKREIFKRLNNAFRFPNLALI